MPTTNTKLQNLPHPIRSQKNNTSIQLKGPISNLYDQNFVTKIWWGEKSVDQKLPVEIGNKLQIINQIRKKKNVNLSADNSQVKKVHYK